MSKTPVQKEPARGGTSGGGAAGDGTGSQQRTLTSFFKKATPEDAAGAAFKPIKYAVDTSRNLQISERLLAARKDMERILDVIDESTKRGPKTKSNKDKIIVVQKAIREMKDSLELWEEDEWDTYVLAPRDYLVRINADLVPQEHGGNFGLVEDDGEHGRAKVTQESKINKVTKLLQYSLLHIWTKNGEHVRFTDVNDYMDKCQLLLGFTPGKSSAYRHIQDEKERYLSGKGMRRQPDVGELTLTYQSIKDAYFACAAAEPEQTGARFKVKPEWYPSLKEGIEELERSTKGGGGG
jgi:hypothetical protein